MGGGLNSDFPREITIFVDKNYCLVSEFLCLGLVDSSRLAGCKNLQFVRGGQSEKSSF